MSIFSSIGNAIKKVAGGVVSVVSPVAKTVVGSVAAGLGIGGATSQRIEIGGVGESIRIATEQATQTTTSAIADSLAALAASINKPAPAQAPASAGFSLTPTTMLLIGGGGLALVFLGGKLK